jgi:hypothetical protein
MWDSLDGTTQYPSRFSFPFPREAKHPISNIRKIFGIGLPLSKNHFLCHLEIKIVGTSKKIPFAGIDGPL